MFSYDTVRVLTYIFQNNVFLLTNVAVVGEHPGEHWPEEPGGDDHEGDDGGAVAAGEANADQTGSRNKGS